MATQTTAVCCVIVGPDAGQAESAIGAVGTSSQSRDALLAGLPTHVVLVGAGVADRGGVAESAARHHLGTFGAIIGGSEVVLERAVDVVDVPPVDLRGGYDDDGCEDSPEEGRSSNCVHSWYNFNIMASIHCLPSKTTKQN